jgi:nitroreductase
MEHEYKKFNEVPLSKFQARYGEELPDNTFPTNRFIETIISRKTVRRFTSQQIDPLLLEKLFAAAQSAPTSSMIQPWSVITITTPEQKLKFMTGENREHLGIKPHNNLRNTPSDPHNITAITECAVFLVWLVDCTIMDNIFLDPSIDQTHPDLNELRKSAHEASRYAKFELRSITDAIIAAQTFVLAAESMGLGTMYCGSLRTMDLKKDLNLPDRVMPLFGICLGYPKNHLDATGQLRNFDVPLFAKPRLPQDLVIHKEVYSPIDFEKVKKYNNLMKKFYEVSNLKYDWFDRVVRRTQIYKGINLKFRALMDKYGFKFK